jgi:hypothetical protein
MSEDPLFHPEFVKKLEADRALARRRIEELETIVSQQQRRLLLLERQLEGANLVPAPYDPPPRPSLLERLLGGPASTPRAVRLS